MDGIRVKFFDLEKVVLDMKKDVAKFVEVRLVEPFFYDGKQFPPTLDFSVPDEDVLGVTDYEPIYGDSL